MKSSCYIIISYKKEFANDLNGIYKLGQENLLKRESKNSKRNI